MGRRVKVGTTARESELARAQASLASTSFTEGSGQADRQRRTSELVVDGCQYRGKQVLRWKAWGRWPREQRPSAHRPRREHDRRNRR
jgi:hypothetical protein